MKNKISHLGSLTLVAVALFATGVVFAQDTTQSTTTTTTTNGTVSQFSPNTIVVKTTESTAPVSYSYTKTTVYVDENGKAVSSETVKSGAPVTIYYDKNGEKMVATKVIVKKTTTTTAP